MPSLNTQETQALMFRPLRHSVKRKTDSYVVSLYRILQLNQYGYLISFHAIYCAV